ncbi:class I SAM-dependent methyltransferase [Variovorax paradoxus]|uniref:class I SAM-dependent methyltransferase n=1 Tax=Variovorax paradoxus TaxID=34073 RepID=UPI0027889243|nr:class I SAM-dependent methyltransferase [Variovorax paradoxus]MDQ0589036.1 SAM-dependent methyltransferase [Variovorax paradoxus]
MDSNLSSPAGHLTHFSASQNSSLKSFSTDELFSELISRTAFSVKASTEKEGYLAHQLCSNLSRFSDVHLNRHSITNLKNVYSAFLRSDINHRLPIRDSTWVELGCGSINPWSFSFLLLALGAKRAIPIDLDPVGDSEQACRTLAEIVKILLVNPALIIGGDSAGISQQDILNNLRGFGLKELSDGSMSGIAESRLDYRVESVYALTVPHKSVDVVVSNAFFEHVPDVNRAVESIARITKPGGYGVHIIDTIDHWVYGAPDSGPLDFLKVDSAEPLVNGCNRVRPKEFPAIFEKHGFEVLHTSYGNVVSLTEDERRTFASPWSSMPLEDLTPTVINIVVRLVK